MSGRDDISIFDLTRSARILLVDFIMVAADDIFTENNRMSQRYFIVLEQQTVCFIVENTFCWRKIFLA